LCDKTHSSFKPCPPPPSPELVSESQSLRDPSRTIHRMTFVSKVSATNRWYIHIRIKDLIDNLIEGLFRTSPIVGNLIEG
jgi:hypothetical protein